MGNIYERYTHVQFDLKDIHGIDDVISGILEQIPLLSVECIGLINNAAMLEPLKPIDQCLADEISVHLNISLAAPMILTSSFIQHTNHITTRRKIINVSSASGNYPAPSMATYCTSKAGINMFTQCVAMEQASYSNPVEIVALIRAWWIRNCRPWRGKECRGTCAVRAFRDAYELGQLKSPRDVALEILKLLEGAKE